MPRGRPHLLPLALALLAYAIAFAQRPGKVIADTKVHLYLDPAQFLRDVTSLWISAPDLGHVWSSQYGGYVWPMAPWFAAGDALGLPAWVVQRLWLGTMLALAAWGMVRLLDAMITPRRGALHAAAAVLFIVNPWVTVYSSRTSAFLLPLVTLPWLMLCVHRGVRDPRAWRWPALFALIFASAGGGVNAATFAWSLVGPALLLVYDRFAGEVPRGAIRPFLTRLAPLAFLANIWWLVPLLMAGRGSPNFLVFTEQPGTIWSTTSLTESLRLMGFWTSYVGTGFGGLLRPYQSSAPAMLYLAPVVICGLLVPALSLAAVPWTRRFRHLPFFALLTLAGVLFMVAGWPEGTPLQRALLGAYYKVEALQPLRTSYKAGSLVALGLAVLGGGAFALAWRRWPRLVVGAAGTAIVALASWPLVTGRAVQSTFAFEVPPAWKELAADLDRRPDNTRALVLPGQVFAAYQWGATNDAVLPGLAEHPVTTRWIVPFSDLRSADLQFAVDSLVTQERLRPGQLRPLLDLMGVGDVVIAADGDRSQSGEMPAADAQRVLAGAGGLRGGKTYGPLMTADPGAGQLATPLRVPALRRIEVPTAGMVRVLPRDGGVIADGASGAVTGLAAYGALRTDRALRYAPDVGAEGIRAAAAAPGGGTFVISDSNRRRAFVASRARAERGPTLPPEQGITADGTQLDPFGDLTTDPQTVAVIGGIESVFAPSSPQTSQFPDRRPFAALDGDPATAWIADRNLARPRHVMTVKLLGPTDIPALDLLPYSDSHAIVREVTINGKVHPVRRGWNRIAVGLRGARTVEVAISEVSRPEKAKGGAGGIRELRIPGVKATEALRPPTVIENALRGRDLGTSSLTYLLERTTADVPLAQQRYVGERTASRLRDVQDPERVLTRVIDPPAARRYTVDGWGTVDPRTSDELYASVASAAGSAGREEPALTAFSSSRFSGLGRYRAAGAFDGGPRSWIGEWVPGRPAWISWRTGSAQSLERLTLSPVKDLRVRRPTRVRLTVDGRPGPVLAVGAGGVVELPGPVRGREFRLDVVAARFPAGTSARERQRRAVGIGEIVADGLPRIAVPRSGRLELPCGRGPVLDAGAAGKLSFRASTTWPDLDAGKPVRLESCGELSLPAGTARLTDASKAAGSLLRIDSLRLSSPAPRAAAPVTGQGGRVLDPGTEDHGARDGVRVQVSGPAWLMLGQSYDRAWRAACDGRDLGEPVPIQGYANGWPVTRGCTDVRFEYSTQRLATIAYVISGGTCALLLALLMGIGVRRVLRRRQSAGAGAEGAAAAAPAGSGERELDPVARPLPARAAVGIAVAAGVVAGGLFGLRAGVVAVPVLWLVLSRGLADRTLALIAGGLLGVVVPIIYVLVEILSDEDHTGGNAVAYVAHRISAHWVAVAAFVLLAVVVVRSLAAVFRGDGEDVRDGGGDGVRVGA